MTMVIASYLIGDVVRYAHPINVLLKGQTHVKCQVRKIEKKSNHHIGSGGKHRELQAAKTIKSSE
jgi:hypothetical protein